MTDKIGSHISHSDAHPIVVVEGDLTSAEAGQSLETALAELYQQGEMTVILDLSNVEMINSYGLNQILKAQQKFNSERGILMIKPLRGFVEKTFKLLQIDKLFPVVD